MQVEDLVAAASNKLGFQLSTFNQRRPSRKSNNGFEGFYQFFFSLNIWSSLVIISNNLRMRDNLDKFLIMGMKLKTTSLEAQCLNEQRAKESI